MNLKDNKTKVILFFMITGWLRVLILVIPAIFLYINTGDLRDNVNQEQSIVNDNDYIPTLKIEQGN
tara:strand:- start:146 stop:343 length:198 start_codon:yes stop_codon:yes gene_type:complete